MTKTARGNPTYSWEGSTRLTISSSSSCLNFGKIRTNRKTDTIASELSNTSLASWPLGGANVKAPGTLGGTNERPKIKIIQNLNDGFAFRFIDRDLAMFIQN